MKNFNTFLKDHLSLDSKKAHPIHPDSNIDLMHKTLEANGYKHKSTHASSDKNGDMVTEHQYSHPMNDDFKFHTKYHNK